MPNLSEVLAQVEKVPNGKRYLNSRAVKTLPDILMPEESVINLIEGVYDTSHGILACTEKRLVFVEKGILYGHRVEDFPFSKVTSVEATTGLLMGDLIIHASGNKAIIRNVPNTVLKPFANSVRNLIAGQHSPQPQVEKSSQPVADNFDQLEKLHSLFQKGILTEQEFLEQKKKLLSS